MNKEAYNRLKSKLTIDLMQLDQELIEMPSLIQEASELAAQAVDEQNKAHHIFDIIKTEASNRLRNTTEKSKQPSETQIVAQLAAEVDVQEARQAYDDAQYEAKLVASLVNALSTKSKSLEHTTKLIIAGYITPNSAYEQRKSELRR